MGQPRRSKTKAYVLLPLQGVQFDGASLQEVTTLANAREMRISKLLEWLRLNGDSVRTTRHSWIQHARERGSDRPYSVAFIDSFTEDGPKLVQAAAEGERALRAAGFHLVPVTTYRLTPHSEPVLLDETALVSATEAQRDWLRRLHDGIGAGPRGDGVKVAIVDSGVDGTHPALKEAVEGGRGLVPGEDHADHHPCTDSRGGHGTHVAGIVGARDSRLPGVAPECRIRSYRVFPKAATSRGASNFSIINAIREAVADGCHIVNLSISGHSAVDDGVRKVIEEAWNRGVVCIAAAGNNHRRPVGYPARHAACIAVTALGHDGFIPKHAPDRHFIADPRSRVDPSVFLASFSNFGPQVDFAGPGVWVVSTLPQGRWAAMSGTSMAAPAVSGIAAVLLSRNAAMLARPDAGRSEWLFQALVSRSVAYDLGSFDFEGYGVPQ